MIYVTACLVLWPYGSYRGFRQRSIALAAPVGIFVFLMAYVYRSQRSWCSEKHEVRRGGGLRSDLGKA